VDYLGGGRNPLFGRGVHPRTEQVVDKLRRLEVG
jgi:hypothetical protein